MSEAPTHFYNINNYTDKSAADNKEHRLVVISFKTPSDKKDDKTYIKQAAQCISIPQLTVYVNNELLQDALQSAFEDLQDATIRKMIVDGLAPGGKRKLAVSDDEIGYIAVAAYAQLAAQSGKLSEAAIQQWFDLRIADVLTVALANALQFPDKMSDVQAAKLETAIAQHRTLFGKLAAPKASLDKKIAVSLLKAVNLCPVDEQDKVYHILSRKLAACINPPTQELLGL